MTTSASSRISGTAALGAAPAGLAGLDVRRAAAPLGLSLSVLLYALLALGYAVRTPVWQNPDEPAHYNYVVQVAETGTLPTLQPGDWDARLLDRLKNGQLAPGDSIATIRYEGWQPPLFYVLAAPVVWLDRAAAVERQLLDLRLLDALFGGLTLVVGYLAARQVLPLSLALAVPLVMAGVPMFTAVAAGLSAEPLANLMAAVLVLVLLRSLRRRQLGWRWALGVGVLLGLGLLTKLALGLFVPLCVALVVVRGERRVREAVVLLGSLGLVLVPWLVHQVTSYGWTDPLATQRHAAVVADQPRFPGLSPDYVRDFGTISFHSFWAQFGWMAIPAPERLYWMWGGLVLLALGGLLIRLVRRRWQPVWLMLVATVALAGLAYVAYNLMFLQLQGRYLFPALVPLAILLVVGWSAWFPRRLRRVRAPAALGLALALVALNGYALLRVLTPGFAPSGGV